MIYPGRGVNMGDGWETRRSREPNHSDWVIVKLGASGKISNIDIDTNHYKGNYPKFAMLEGCNSKVILKEAQKIINNINYLLYNCFFFVNL